MEALAPIIAPPFMLLVICTGFFLLAVTPIWGLIDVAVDTKQTSGTKVAVILLTLFPLGPIMTFFYALFITNSRIFRKMTVTATALCFVSVVAVIIAAALSPKETPTGSTPNATASIEPPPAETESVEPQAETMLTTELPADASAP